MSVLSLMVLMLANMLNLAGDTSSQSSKRVDADAEARVVFGNMAENVREIVLRQDLDHYMVRDADGDENDQLYFFSRSRGHFPGGTVQAKQSPFSLIGYRINTTAASSDPYALERLAIGMMWADFSSGSPNQIIFNAEDASGSKAANTIPTNWVTELTTSAPGYTDVLGPQTFRFEYTFLVRGGDGVPPSLTIHQPDDPKDIVAIIVGIAVLDATSRIKVDDLSRVISVLPNAEEGKDLLELWEPIVAAPDFATTAGLPQQVASAVRVYQRYFYLPALP